MKRKLDFQIYAKIEDIVKVFKQLGFSVECHKGYYSCRLWDRWGRFDALLKELSLGIVYCDFHWDSLIHFIFLAVDYRQKPQRFFEEKLKPRLLEKGLYHEVTGGFSWFSRRNKALLHGLKL
jgi:hypothetical protein